MKIEKITSHTFASHLDDGQVLILSNRMDYSMESFANTVWSRSGNWETFPHTVGTATVVPYGRSNDLPTFIRDVVNDNNLVPGVIVTPRNDEALANVEYAKKVLSGIPTGFAGQPSDCVGAALQLCSDAGRYITGMELPVDGGMKL